jgi:uncharacterized protein YfaS (alpha-2-macroglobulin family)
MSHAARALLIFSLPADLVDPVISDLESGAVLSATGAHWEETGRDFYNWGSDTRSTSLAILALLQADPQNELIPNAIRWLVTARSTRVWSTTQENAWAITSLLRWADETGEADATYSYEARFNAVPIIEGEAESQTLQETGEAVIPVDEFAPNVPNRVNISRAGEDQGALYYSAFLNLRLPIEAAEAYTNGISVERDYYLGADKNQTIASAVVDDTITVRVTINVPQDVYYFVLEDPIPAGTEPLDSSLLTTTQLAGSATLRPFDEEDPFWYFGWWIFNRTELRDEQTVLFADLLPRGTYVYSYQVRAVTPGTFNVLPTHGYAAYQPDVFGRSDGDVFTITE